MAIALNIKTQSGEETTCYLKRTAISIGRSSQADVKVEDPQCSSLHCSIELAEGKVLVKDLNSKNGTHINRNTITQRPLHLGDTLQIGNTIISIDETKLSNHEATYVIAPSQKNKSVSFVPDATGTLSNIKRKLREALNKKRR